MAELGLKSRFFFLNFTSFKKTLSFVFGSGVTYSQRNHNKSLFPWPAESLFLPGRACTLSLQGSEKFLPHLALYQHLTMICHCYGLNCVLAKDLKALIHSIYLEIGSLQVIKLR